MPIVLSTATNVSSSSLSASLKPRSTRTASASASKKGAGALQPPHSTHSSSTSTSPSTSSSSSSCSSSGNDSFLATPPHSYSAPSPPFSPSDRDPHSPHPLIEPLVFTTTTATRQSSAAHNGWGSQENQHDLTGDCDSGSDDINSRPMKHRTRDRGTPSPSLSPPPSSCSLSSSSSSSSFSALGQLHGSSLTFSNAPFSPLSPPASTATALSPFSILPSEVDSDQQQQQQQQQRQLTSDPQSMDLVDTATNAPRSSSPPSSSSPPPLPPSSSSCSLSERRGSESEHDQPRTKRRRSMDSPRQCPSPAEHNESSKGVSCPVSVSVFVSVSGAAASASTTPTDPCQGDVVQRLLDECESRAVTGEPYGRPSETVSSESVMTVIEAPLTIAPASTRQQQRRRPTSPSRKPDFSYVEMITQALVDVNKPKMTLAEIYLAIVTNHPYYLDAGTGWQNSIRHCLSLNNAFTKIDRTLEEPGKGCFWALRKEGDAPKMPCRKRKGRDTASSAADLTAAARNVTARVKAVSLSSLDGMVDLSVSSNSPGSFPDSAPSPAASEDAEDAKAPRRSGRARRPPRPKEAEEYIGHARHSSATGASLSTPPSSPAPYGQENETHQSALPLRKRASSVKSEFGVFASDQEESPSALSSRKGIQDNIDLTSVPGVVTTQRIRRPPQNLAEFVSSEDFKASPCGKRQERTLQSSTSSTSLNGTSGDGTGRDKWEACKGRSESQLSFSASSKRSALLSDMDQDQDQNQDQDPTTDSTQAFEEGHERSASMPDLATAANVRGRDKEAQPATIPLSALSHSKRSSQDFSCMGTKKQRRDGKDGKAPRPGYTKRHSTNSFPSRQEILERRRRDGKREIMVASEDDYSDSDFDFLRDEQENYRLMRIRARKMQRARGWWRSSYDDDDEDEDDDEEVRRKEDAKRCGDVAGYGGCIKEEYSQAEGETLKLLMDPSVINYGFDSGDGEYILDFHQGPLFNNVTWPEFSDVKEEGASKGIHPHHTTNTLATSTNTSTATATTTTTGTGTGTTTDTDMCGGTVSDAEMAAVVAAAVVAMGAGGETHVHMEGSVKEEIEAEDFIGWSLCE